MESQKLCFLLHILLISFTNILLPAPSHTAAAAAELCHPVDTNALLQIKQSSGNPDILRTWDPNTDCCHNWNGVECDPRNNRVTYLELQQSSQSGQISPAIGDLTEIGAISFHDLPNLYGTIPHTLTRLKRLDVLKVTNTSISGPIPEFLSQMTALESLNLTGNQFTGSIPRSLVRLTNLLELSLDNNRLTGSIPENFGSFRQEVLHLTLAGNQLKGRVPRSFKNGNFAKLDLSRNRLTGDASFVFASRRVFHVDVSRNRLSFDLSKVKFKDVLQYIDISHNSIHGRLPRSLTRLKYLSHLDVSYNNLCGPIPTGGLLQGFGEAAYSHNKCLCGAPLLLACPRDV